MNLYGSSNRKKSYGSDDEESNEELKAAFVCITNNEREYIKSAVELTKALQCCGRNPTEERVNNYWSKFKNSKVDFDDFCNIAKKESLISKDQLIDSFKTIDINKDGFISIDELHSILKSKGEKLSRAEVEEILDDADLDKDGKLNYKEFSRLVFETIDKTKRIAKRRMNLLIEGEGRKSRDSSRGRNSPALSRSRRSSLNSDDSDDDLKKTTTKKPEKLNESIRSKRSNRSNHNSDEEIISKKNTEHLIDLKLEAPKKFGDTFQEPKNLKKWTHNTIKGAFYLNEKLMANSYVLELKEESKVYFELEPFETQLHTVNVVNTDILLLAIKDGKKKTLKAITEEKFDNKWCCKCKLEPGRYFLFPYTTGCHFKQRDSEIRSTVKLTQKDIKGRNVLTKDLTDALNVIFDLFDYDSNGRLNRQELDSFLTLTEKKPLSDDDWKALQENFHFEKKQLTKEGFIDLHKQDVSSDEFDKEELWSKLTSIGFNKSLKLDNICPFNFKIACETGEYNLHVNEIYPVASAESFLHEHIENNGKAYSIKGVKDVVFYEYHNVYMSMIMIANNKDNDFEVKFNCENSENCVSNQANDKLKSQIISKQNKKKIGIILMPKSKSKEWYVRCDVKLVN